MYNRYLEKKLHLVPEEENIGGNIPIELEYYLIESVNNDFNTNLKDKSYGIEIVKKVDDSKYESEMLKEISNCIENTKRILNRLANNTVTPMEMTVIIDDILAE
jgi:DNA-dependent RNA polymerase auxiliary subunit epsilon